MRTARAMRVVIKVVEIRVLENSKVDVSSVFATSVCGGCSSWCYFADI